MNMLPMNEINDNVKNNSDKYPSDKNHHYYYSTKYWDRIKNTNHCYEKNIAKGVILLPVDATIFTFNIIGTIGMNLCYIIA